MNRFEIKQRAEEDLREIGAFIARDNPDRAESFIFELIERIAWIGENPLLYRERFDWDPGLRVAHHGRYRILYRARDDFVEILRVAHSARDLDAILDDLG